MIKIQGTLRTLSPLSVAVPGDRRVNLAGNFDSKGFPCTQIARMELPGNTEMGVDPVRLPVIPANTLRGGLRRSGADLIEQSLIARGEKISLSAFHSLRSGAPFGHPDKGNPNLAEIREAQTFAHLGVFGGGPRMLTGALRVDTGMPVTAAALDRGLVPQSSQSESVSGRLDAVLWLRRADDAATFINHDMAQNVIRDYANTLDAWQVLIGPERHVDDPTDDDSSEKKAATKEIFRGIAGFNAYEVVLPGVPFAVRYDLDSDHEANAGFLMLALEAFANKQILGGMKRLGYGRFALDLTVTFPDGSSTPLLTRSESRHSLNAEHPMIAQLVAAATKWLASLTSSEIERLLAPSETARAEVRKKVSKNASLAAAYDAVYGGA
ncbi:MAG: type IV CRISPR-associated protein Csf2 [Lysobacterales bacterium CG02_land_8_20_14_3_00_62_12]|nr:MAG: type IV CRISPR-associated protein Csf2 [Xanthomonadales bacterium CG02_land_8_20_14_3_00_62_12]